jgi:very-short-patch-repair endonuclease
MTELVHWRERVSGALSKVRTTPLSVDAVWELPIETLSWIASAERSDRPLSAIMRDSLTAHSLLRQRIVDIPDSASWPEVAKRATHVSTELGELADTLRTLAVPHSLALADRHEVIKTLSALGGVAAQALTVESVHDVLGSGFDGLNTDTALIRRTLAFARNIVAATLPATVKDWLLGPKATERFGRLSARAADVAERSRIVHEAWTAFGVIGQIETDSWFGNDDAFSSQTLKAIRARAQVALAGEPQFSSWCDYSSASDRLRTSALKFLVDLAATGQLRSSALRDAFRYVHANSLVDEAFRAHPKLAQFAALSHEQVRERFQALDRECIALQRQRAALMISGIPVPGGIGYGPAASYTDLRLLEREMAKQKRHIPLRALMRRASGALQALKPCFMMGPLSVAQYLEPGKVTFDLLIVDEASQLRPQDALGAIARVDQVVIVGDQKQLPPTSFFDRIGEEDDEAEEETGAIEDAESILDVATSLYRPARMLKWHYRSRHGSLIAFSNKEFYKNELVVFPSPTPSSGALGIKFIHVPEGVFESRRNKAEAQRIVRSAVLHMEQRQDETLGIVAMNAPQRELIEDLLEQELKRHSVAAEYVKSPQNILEPLFVKNLENVQGDERDVIYISATYGKTVDGHFHQRFGPVTGPTGHRRLNVLFTRARKRVVLFSSMTADNIRVQPNSSHGVRALKGYLHYAATGILETALFSGREPDSDFEVEVASALRERGLEVVAQVGVAGYFIDLAVKDPDKIDAFILGIECDGATYHSSLSARDRDRLRQSVLEDLGWNIHRVWSTDWFRQPEREVSRIMSVVERARARNLRAKELAGDSIAAEWEVDARRDVEVEWLGEVAAQPLTDDQVRAPPVSG